MTAVSYPRSGPAGDPGRNWTQPQWRVYHADDTGIVGSPGGAARQVFADGSGPYIKRLPGARYIQGIYGADDATWQGTVADNATSQWRIDRVVDELGEDGVISTVIVPGTAATTPTAPDLTQTPGGVWQEHLASFRVKPGFASVTSADAAVVDERRYVPARVTPISSEAQRIAAPRFGDENVYPDGRRERWNGSAWATLLTPAETWTPSVRSTGIAWSLAVATGSRSRANGWVDGWSLATLANNGPSFQPASAPALPVYTALPYAPPSGYRGPAGTWGYVTDTGAPVAAGALVVGYDAYEGAARLTLAGGVLFTSNQWSLTCLWRYPAA